METRSPWAQHAASCPAGRGVAGPRYQFSQPDRQYRYVNANGTFLLSRYGALAEMERELIVERTRAGLAAARAQGRWEEDAQSLHRNSGSRWGDLLHLESHVSELRLFLMLVYPPFIVGSRPHHLNDDKQRGVLICTVRNSGFSLSFCGA